MRVTLKKVTLDNFDEVADLELLDEQENYVASNAYSIAQSKFYPAYQPRAIYCDDQVVGFLMYTSLVDEGKPNEYSIFRLMLDYRHQGKGIGRRALLLLLREIQQNKDTERITICYVPENPVAKNFYESFGFVEIGLDDDGEMQAEIRL